MQKLKTSTYYAFLDSLRDSGKINMFGAPMVLVTTFGISMSEARIIFWDWVEQFNEETNMSLRL
jgi:hypothetical protein